MFGDSSLTLINSFPVAHVQREHELRIAEARSHAAHVSAAKRNHRRQTTPTKLSTTTRYLQYTDDTCTAANGNLTRYSILKHVCGISCKTFKLRINDLDIIPRRGCEDLESVLDYVAYRMAPGLAVVFNCFNVRFIYPSFFFQLLLEDDFFYTGIAMVQNSIERLQKPYERPSPSLLKNLSRGIKSLRCRLDNNNGVADDLSILISVFLATTAIIMGDMNAFQVHSSIISPLLRSRGGVETVQECWTQVALLQWEESWSLMTGRSFRRRINTTQVSTMPNQRVNWVIKGPGEMLPVGFYRLASQKRISEGLTEVLVRVATMSATGQSPSDLISNQGSDFASSPYFLDFCQACPGLKALENCGNPNVESLIVLALQIHCFHTFGPQLNMPATLMFYRAKLVEMMKTRLQYAVEKEEVLLWTWMVLVNSFEEENGKLPNNEKQNPLGEIQRALSSFGRWLQIESILKRFFWSSVTLERCQLEWPRSN